MRMPATTSSPWAFCRNSPITFLAPVEGSRVNSTPVPLSSPILPNTIAWMFTAVPIFSSILLSLRYSIARSFIQLSNTALIAARSCSLRSCGKAFPGRFLERPFEVLHQLHQLLHRELVVVGDAGFFLRLGELEFENVVVDPVGGRAQHLDQPAVAVERRLLADPLRPFGQRWHR